MDNMPRAQTVNIKDIDSTMHQFIMRFNEAWKQQNWLDLDDMLHDNIVFDPSASVTVSGKEKCIDSLRNFVSLYKTDDIEILSLSTVSSSSSCIVRWHYHIRYHSIEKTFEETGSELWVLAWEDSKWKLLFRKLLK
jgi:hypothetical protein